LPGPSYFEVGDKATQTLIAVAAHIDAFTVGVETGAESLKFFPEPNFVELPGV